MRIKELALDVGVPIETIRYYERTGLMPQAMRSHNNYREYSGNDRDRLRFIRNCRTLDMNLDEIRALLAFIDQAWQGGTELKDCSGIHAVIERHLTHVQQRLQSLRMLEKQLKHLMGVCHHSSPAQACDMVKELFSEQDDVSLSQYGHGVHTT